MIIVKLQGGLGNQMFQFAFAKYMAMQKNDFFCLDVRYLKNSTSLKRKFVNREFDLEKFVVEKKYYKSAWSFPYQNYIFPIFEKVIRYMPVGLLFAKKQLFVEKSINETITQIETGFFDNRVNIYFSGYFQTCLFAEQIKDELRQDFIFKNKINPHFQSLLFEIKNKESVCLHIRRGDYLGNSLYDVIDENYYHRAITKITKLTDNPTIYVFSDDISWCKKNLSISLAHFFVETDNSVETDFELMRNCKHFIIPNSTFSWWAAFLGDYKNKIVITPKLWLKEYEGNELVPQEWIRV